MFFFQVLSRSSEISRAMESTYCQLAGVYPPKGRQVWNQDLLWQPIPVYTKSLLDDPVCPSLSQKLKIKTIVWKLSER